MNTKGNNMKKNIVKTIAVAAVITAGFAASGWAAEPVPYLHFTAVGEAVTIGMEKVGEPGAFALETAESAAAESWAAFTPGSTTVNVAAGKTVFFRRKGEATNALSAGKNDYWKFTMTGSGTVQAGGDVGTLLDAANGATEVAAGGLFGLFKDCTALTVGPVIGARTMNSACYGSMFEGCANLKRLEADFAAFKMTATANWLKGVAASGVLLLKTAAIPAASSDSTCPAGWTAAKISTITLPKALANCESYTVTVGGLELVGEETVVGDATNLVFKAGKDYETVNVEVAPAVGYTAKPGTNPRATFLTNEVYTAATLSLPELICPLELKSVKQRYPWTGNKIDIVYELNGLDPAKAYALVKAFQVGEIAVAVTNELTDITSGLHTNTCSATEIFGANTLTNAPASVSLQLLSAENN